ncbi:MAG: protein translocase subunit SecD [Parcubacteria group bacterium]|nr:protein translocase subunit SecD [Parcubacteria group bacterium]MCR4343054.1 protein translocase subunit SecD [Patescibacteria group bacterium]
MFKIRILAIFFILAGISIGYFTYSSELGSGDVPPRLPFKLGLDLQGGSHLLYKADVSSIDPSDIDNSMAALRDVIERRVNLFGVSEPLVQVEETGVFSAGKEKEYRLVVELPGVTDLEQAVAMIGQTPFLEFKTERDTKEQEEIFEAQKIGERLYEDPYFVTSDLTGRYIKKAVLEFDSTTFEPKVGLEFNKEGETLFAKLTKENVGKRIAIYLDGAPISVPVVREEITSGTAEISGGFTAEEAKLLVGRLNSGALPVPIEIISEQGIGATLGGDTLMKGIRAGVYGIVAVAIFLILYYRLAGLLAVASLSIYTVLMLFLFKVFGFTLTSAGIAGFILSVGMAVDANVIIFERIKEELQGGKMVQGSISDGFSRAWLSIRDANISSIITAIILFWFGTSLVKGFALVFGLGVLISMFSAITVSKVLFLSLGIKEGTRFSRFLLGGSFN